jgi:thymidine kinase
MKRAAQRVAVSVTSRELHQENEIFVWGNQTSGFHMEIVVYPDRVCFLDDCQVYYVAAVVINNKSNVWSHTIKPQ